MIRLGTSEYGGTFFTQGAVFAELFNRGRSEGDRCVVQTSEASIHNANMLDRGEIEFGFMASNWIGRAKDATPPFARNIALRMVAPANAGPMFFVKLANSPIQTIEDFTGKRIVIGTRGSGMEQHVHTIFDVLGISFDSFIPVHMGFDEGANALVAGEIDAQFQPPIPNRVMSDLSQRADVRVVPYAPGQLDKVLREVPFYRKVTMAKGVFRGVVEDVAQLAVINVLVTHERIADDIVHDMAKVIVSNLDKLPEMNPLFRGLKDLFESLRSQGAAAFEFGGVPLHPGAIRAYKAAGWLQ
ncbi:MAG TPA: TAXI family TRAP transporter solute-binding subunit [Candidatus Binatia bacterium]|nr:TAXI family TRAP transporter solute-binding subunit [Candidatus Binatia bacterium]